ncbi:MAG: efflux RND transporter periplasmic adaptor subunit [Methylomonas sp.]|jgi:RND family efflux transporter MFP subunit
MTPFAFFSAWAGAAKLLLIALLFLPLSAPAAAAGQDKPQAATDVAVETGTIVRKTLTDYLTAYGAVEPEPAGGGKPPASAAVTAQTAGVLIEARCEEGQKVKRGQLLFNLDHRLADAQIEKAKSGLRLAEKNLQRKRALIAGDNVSQKLLDEAQQLFDAAQQDLAIARIQSSMLRVAAPLAGTVVRINIRPGEAVSANSVLADVVNLDRLAVNVAIPGTDLPLLRLGQSAVLSTAANSLPPGMSEEPPANGSVSFIGLQVDVKNAALPVRIALPAGSGLRPGQFVKARIAVAEHAGRLAVPAKSVVTVDGQPAIYLVEQDLARRVPVQTGLEDAGWMEVAAEGLRAGMAVVTAGAYGLPAASRIHRLNP